MKIDLTGTFGLSESEEAAKRVLEMCDYASHWDTGIRLEQFRYDGERIGFLRLIFGRYLAPTSMMSANADHGCYVVMKAFVKRVRPKLVASDVHFSHWKTNRPELLK